MLDNQPTASQTSSYAPSKFMPPFLQQLLLWVPQHSGTGFGISTSETAPVSNILADSKRDPRRVDMQIELEEVEKVINISDILQQDPRRLDPRRLAVPVEVQSAEITDDQLGVGGSLSSPVSVSLTTKSESTILPS
ncbi:hypothetical protein QJS10_CPA05g01416 [Acorus calamus]|uniref:Uncharacterized protein n=1 Tax=Acorus calamus TaxID=4465 RepID=A0AAV9EVE9_ACOCL|nr:hypothetical protein QJS10_CPA05g01416 [Acorus calamus]